MTLYININQKAFVDISEATNINLDIKDANIFEYIYKFSLSPKIQKKLINNKVYLWISYQKIIEDNPLLRINDKEAIAKRINKLIKAGLLEKYVAKEEGNKTYFAITDLAFETIVEGKELTDKNRIPLTDENTKPLPMKIGKVSDENTKPLTDENRNNSKLKDNKLDSKLDSKLEKTKKFSFSLKRETQYENLSKDYKEKLKAKLLLEFGTQALDKLEDFELSCESKGYKYKNFYSAFKRWYKNELIALKKEDYKTHDNLPKDFVIVGKYNDKVYAVNKKTLEVKIGEVKQKVTPQQEVLPLEHTPPANNKVFDILSNKINRF